MERVQATPTARSTAPTRAYRAKARPEVIGDWVMVTAIEAFLLIALTPAFLHQYGAVGWFGLALGGLMALLSYLWYQGKPLGYPLLALFFVLSYLLLLGAGIAFLSTLPPITALVYLLLAYITASAWFRGERRAGILLSVVWAVLSVVLFAAATGTGRQGMDLTLLLLIGFLLTSGAATFLFGVRFRHLRDPRVMAYFGYGAEPPILTTVERTYQALQGFLAQSYALLNRLLHPLQQAVTQGTRTLQGSSQAIPRRMRGTLLAAAVVVGLALLPLLVRELEQATNLSLLITMNVALIFVVLALGLNIVVGFAGLLDLGYAAFFAIGAYTVGIFTWPNLGLEWNFWIVIWISVVMAAIFGMIIGAPTLRLRGDYLAIVTLAFGEIVPRAIREMWDIKIRIPFTEIYLVGSKLEGFNLTNGPQGMNPVGRPTILGMELGVDPIQVGPLLLSPPMQWYLLIVVIGAIVLLASHRLEHSRLGRAWMAIREDETAADAMGVDPIRTKLLAFALGASFSGFAGAIYAAMIQAIFPELFSFLVSIFLLIIVIVSGMGNIWGVLAGGLLISLFDRVVLAQIVPQYVPGGDVLQRWRWVMYATGLIAIMVLRPEGLFPSATRAAELHEADEEYAFREESLDPETQTVVGEPPVEDRGGNW